ncbi:hypothetical protein SBOR_0507 [Sclerotinia borealis F-4128]|uniref:Uncharacterized protein n=1 Tax=Sclerotinia borealis (strain F-4128) TaxID=1432307 RepID=W9CQI6_SCLBF|nr:hypothetical protein SBOR_0507 [Sclerotinia borealis F-4128]
MSLSKPVRKCPSNCRGCSTLAAMGGGYFPNQPAGSPLGQCFASAQAAGFINTSLSANLNADLMPAPLSIPAKSAKRPVGKPLRTPPPAFLESSLERIAAISAVVEGYENLMKSIDFEGVAQQLAIDHASKAKVAQAADMIELTTNEPQGFDTALCFSPSFNENFNGPEDPRYPLGHTYLPSGVAPLLNDHLFTITTCEEKFATSFVGLNALLMYNAYREFGFDMGILEVRGEWEMAGVMRWSFSLGKNRHMDQVKKVLEKVCINEDAALDRLNTLCILRENDNLDMLVESQSAGMGSSFQEVVKKAVEKTVEKAVKNVDGGERSRQRLVDGPLNTEAVLRMIKKVVELKFDPVDWQGPDWIGSAARISALPSRQRPLQSSRHMNGVSIKDYFEDENDETSCTTYVRLAPTKQLDFSWYERRNDDDRPEHGWPQHVRWTANDGKISEFSMQKIHDNLAGKFSALKKRLIDETNAADVTLTSLQSFWRNTAREMNVFGWFWDEEKRILVQGYRGIDEYEKNCDWIDQQLRQWKQCVEDELVASHMAVKSGNLTKEVKHTLIGEHLLRQWKGGPGMMVSKTPSDETMEGSLLGPHTTDGTSHINYLSVRIAVATRQIHEIERHWSPDTAADEIVEARGALVDHVEALEGLKLDIEEGQEDDKVQSLIFKDKKTRRELKLWAKERREEMRLWEKGPREENAEQNFNFKELRASQSMEEAMKLMDEMCNHNGAA